MPQTDILIYDAAFPKEGYEGRSFLMKWMAHRGSNELLALLGLNQAKIIINISRPYNLLNARIKTLFLQLPQAI